nr:MFS transporter [Microbispora cellulosiformans]
MTTSPDALSAESIGTRLDRLRWSGTHLSILMALGAGWLFDSSEVNLVGSVINPLSEHFQATVEQSSRIFWVWLLGVLFGALAGGVLADRFGRRRLFLVTLLWYSGFTVLTAASPNLEVLYVLRFLTALGVGAEYGIINAAIMEFMPARVRGRSAAAVRGGWPREDGWRRPRRSCGGWSRGRTSTPARPSPGDAPEAPATTHRPALAELVRRYPGRLLLGCVLDLSEAFGYYGLSALLSIVVLKQVHYTDAEIPFFFILGNVGALIGGIGMTLAFDRLGRRWSVGTFYALAAAGIGVLAAATSTGDKGLVLAATMLANAVATGAWTAAYPTFTELFPTHLRAAGIGTSVAVGRIGAAYGALYLPTLAVQIGATASYVLIAAFWSIGAIAMIVWSVSGGVDGARQPLSALSAGARGTAGLSPSAGPLTK